MPNKRQRIPTYLRHSLAVLIIFLMGISIARLLVTMHQQDERIQILEDKVVQLMADTTRLQLPQRYYGGGYTDQPSYTRSQRRSSPASAQRTHADRQPASDSGANTATSTTEDSSINPIVSSTEDVATVTAESNTSYATTPSSSHKFTTPHLFDLNTIDSLTLIRIPGIASRTASVILRQRQRYGGFHSAEQLREFLTWDAALDYLDEWCTKWFFADANRLQTIPINEATIAQLQRHPYITHDQAVEISHYRTRHRRFTSATELQQLSTFTPQQLQDLLPYLSFK